MGQPSHERKKIFGGDRSRMAIYALIGVTVLLSTVLAGLIMDANAGESRLQDELLPRNLDIWAVYPDGSVRFVTLIEPEEVNKVPATVDAAGPLLYSADDILKAGILGGSSIETDLLSGSEYFNDPGIEIFYPVYWIEYSGEDVYGVDVFVENSPYVSDDPADENGKIKILNLGTSQGENYAQVIVAVALPKSARVVEMSGLFPYLQREIGDWNVLYYDTSSPPYGAIIRLSFILDPDDIVRELNLATVDRRR